MILGKINLKKRMILSGLVFGLFVFSLSFWVIAPALKNIKKISNEVAVQTREFSYFSSQGGSIESVLGKIKKIKSEIDILEKIFIDDESGLLFSEELEKTAEKNQIKADVSIVSREQSGSEIYDVVKIRIGGYGRYENLVEYLYDLERSVHYVNIDSLTINSKGSGSGEVNFVLSAFTYWKK